MLRPHHRVECLTVHQDAVGGGARTFDPADIAALARQRIDLGENPFSLATQVYGALGADDRAAAALIPQAALDVDKKFVGAPAADILGLLGKILNDGAPVTSHAHAWM